jgi:3-deoxy-manno-octulosonate cytidylyltransferase (CMP-KDO synthetase)
MEKMLITAPDEASRNAPRTTPLRSIGIIPARYAAVRFPAKPLVDLLGKSMIQRVWEGAREAERLQHILIATDDERIANHCTAFGADVVLTSPELPSGTDRILAAVRAYTTEQKTSFDVVVNIQGDEPLLRGDVIDALVAEMENMGNIAHSRPAGRFVLPEHVVCTPVKRITDAEDLTNPNIVKVAMNQERRALYFSRSPIPHIRGVSDYALWLETQHRAGRAFWKHCGIYAYTMSALVRFGECAPSPLEQCEQLEQLRLLEDGTAYVCVETNREFVAIDTPEDAERVRVMLSS